MAKMRIKISKWEWLKMSHQKQMHFERQENDICNPLPSKKKKIKTVNLQVYIWNFEIIFQDLKRITDGYRKSKNWRIYYQ